jgi:hypothetical protein
VQNFTQKLQTHPKSRITNAKEYSQNLQPSTKMQNSTEQKQHKKMKIDHTTYEEARGGRSTSRRASTATKVKDYFSRLTCNADQPSPTTPTQERPSTMWPRFHTAPSDDLPKMTAYLTQKHRSESASQQEKQMTSKANATGKYLSLKELDGNPPVRQILSPPKLRHKGRLSDKVRDKLNQKSGETSNSTTAQKHHKLQKLQLIQREIHAGKWERTVPPSQPHQSSVHAPPRWSNNPFVDPSQSKSVESRRNSKSTSISKKAAEYIGESADLLDSTRRDLLGKFRPPFENLNYPSFSLSRKPSNCSESSSFFCQGEGNEEEDIPAEAVQERRRLSCEGTGPWTQAAPTTCKLCKKRAAGASIRSLCGECERAFMRPKVQAPCLEYSSNPYEFEDEEDEVKPPPPLKDHKYSMGKERRESKPVFNVAGQMKGDAQSVETWVGSVDADSKPTLFHPMVKRQVSQNGVIEEDWGYRDSEEEEENRRRKQQLSRREFEKAQDSFAKWSVCYENDDYGGYENEKDKKPLIEQEKKEKDKRRRTSFYGFYDEVLENPRCDTGEALNTLDAN